MELNTASAMLRVVCSKAKLIALPVEVMEMVD
jgi:hypothetical protein